MKTIAAVLLALAVSAGPARGQTPAPDDLLFDAGVQDIWIHINAKDYRALLENYLENTYYTCDIEWGGRRVFNVGIRSRGQATRNGTKPAFHLEFDHYVRGQRFLGLETLALKNLWHDASMMHEALTMGLFRRMGLPAPRVAFARIFIGSSREYAGLYAVTEDIDEHFLARHYGTNDGYLFEYDRVDEYHLEDEGPSLDPLAARFKPKTHRTASTFELYAPIQEMVRAINDARPEQLEEAVAPFLDLDRFLIYIAVENYLAHWDGFLGDLGMANFYLYRFPDSRRSELLPWDQDNTFTSLDFAPWYNVQPNVLARKIWADARLRTRYLQTLLQVAAVAEGWLEEEVHRVYAEIREAALADPLKYRTDEEFEAGVAFVLDFARERPAWVRRVISDPLPTLPSTMR